MKSNVKIIEPAGIFDVAQSDAFYQKVDEALEQGADKLLIDLSKTTFVDSSGLGVLVVALKKIRAAEKDLYICSVNDQVRMLFELTSMDRVFEILPDRTTFEKEVVGAS
ncbi:MAG: STAS domain-containing protein [Cyanobacteria bacterium P01_F01_bin.86]